jgi:hypothetical protein
MKSSKENITTCSWHRFGMLLALCLGLAGANRAAASVIYDISVPANGSVGAIDVQLTFDGFVTPGAGLSVYGTSGAPVTSFSSGTPVDATQSLEGFEVDAGSTLFGLALLSPSGSLVLLNPDFPADFFSFARTANQTGTFTGTGNVISDLPLNTDTPTATLVVTDTSAVPEPATASLLGLGLGLLGIAGWQMRRRSA